MVTHDTPRDEREKIWALIKDAHIVMLTSQDHGRLRSRPMAACQGDFNDGCLWFFTRAGSPKTEQVEAEHEVNVAYASSDDNSYVSLSGKARLLQDRAAIDAHWNEMVTVWFPDGKDDPELAMLKVEVGQAEYWDSTSSRMVLAFDYLKARLDGSQPDLGEHRKVDLR